ncbi:LysR family transcriptional regulator [Gemmobacter serpentinus]|uniref:LysR family transcriptional regulator n=1 Tax=Gemmobacter serpentinus TaxID=2652247 RepID=UPI00124DC600|nr:LysR family transcriptional regulator [Gemmobacter serpentinus]
MVEAAGRVTLRGIEIFLAVAEARSLSAAARHLGASTSSVSQQLAGLEAVLDSQLFDRGTRPMQMTPAGQILHRHAQTIVNAARTAQAELAMAELSGLTTLRIGVIEDLDADVTPHLLAGLAGELRNCSFLLETGPSHRLRNQLEARALDLVVAADLGATQPAGAGLEIHPLLADPFIAVAPIGAGSVAGLPYIRYSARHYMGRQIDAHLARRNESLPSRFELDSYHAILAMVAAGQGWSILTPLALHHVARFRSAVAVLPMPFGPLERQIMLCARAGVLQSMPSAVAARLRGLLEAQVVAPALTAWPWLAGQFRLL